MSTNKQLQWKRTFGTMFLGLLGMAILYAGLLPLAAAENQPAPSTSLEGSEYTNRNLLMVANQEGFPLSPFDTWTSDDPDSILAYAVAWGDIDGDGDLDLAAGNWNGPNKVYLNQDGILQTTVDNPWSSNDNDETLSVAWGDVDGDGDLDLAVANWASPNKVYLNEGGELQEAASWESADSAGTYSVAWGDVNGDGYLDLAAGNGASPNKIYMNLSGALETTASWTSGDNDFIQSVAWGDVDGDGYLDLAAGNSSGSNRVYMNISGTLESNASWSSHQFDQEDTTSVAWGDADGDGDLDLAVGNRDGPNKVHKNTNGVLGVNGAWQADDLPLNDLTQNMAWGDVDGDGDLDLAVANKGGINKVYLNETTPSDNFFQFSIPWSSADNDDTFGLAWGDVDGDGDLDLAAGNRVGANKIYFNNHGIMQTTADTSGLFGNNDLTLSMAWGDVDKDGDLDLALGNHSAPNKIYLNEAGTLSATAIWTSTDSLETRSVAWGDINGDGYLDLAVGNNAGPNKVYLNVNGSLSTTASWTSADSLQTYSLAWGDANEDGALDLAVGNWNEPNKVYLNINGSLPAAPSWTSSESDGTYSLKWGDVDGDGDLDLATGNGFVFNGPNLLTGKAVNKLYINDKGVLEGMASWASNDIEDTQSVDWGDVDGDGDLDLATGSSEGPNKVYLNENGVLQTAADLPWTSGDSDMTRSVAWGDVDGDGDLDLAAGNGSGFITQVNKIYLNENGVLQTAGDSLWTSEDSDQTLSVAWGDIDGDGDLDLATGNYNGPSKIYLGGTQQLTGSLPTGASSVRVSRPITTAKVSFYTPEPVISDPVIPISYTLVNGKYQSVGQIRAEYSLNGGGQWFAAVAATNTMTTNLTASAWPTGTNYIFYWDTFASGFFGQSNNVVFRIEASPQPANSTSNGSYQHKSQTPFPIQRPYASATTYPFRVRGTQAQVFQEGIDPTQVVSNALVYRVLSNASVATVMGSSTNKPFTTDRQGYLSGQGELKKGDQLFAMLLVTTTDILTLPVSTKKVELYYTSIDFEDGILKTHPVEEPGVQQLIVSADSPLVLFNLDVSLEWDARQDEAYMVNLKLKLRQASDLLFDWSNGQMALGKINIYHNREKWNEADIQILASNRYRPNATLGGIVNKPFSETEEPNQEIVYNPGSVRMGSSWNRLGEASNSLGEDWVRSLAHELGHYLLFMEDNYYGFKDGKFVPVESCTGVMANPYKDSDLDGYDEFHSDVNWLDTCQNTASHQATGRSDWATLQHFYPSLSTPPVTISNTGLITGPNYSPIAPAITEMTTGTIDTLADHTFTLLNSDQADYEATGQAQGFIIQPGGSIVKLGNVNANQLIARGVQPQDQLCVQDLQTNDFGCKVVESAANENNQLTVEENVNWRPDITIQAVSSTTVNITVTMASPASNLEARLYPNSGESIPLQKLGQVSSKIFTGTFNLLDPTLNATLLISGTDVASQQSYVTITDYEMGGSPICWWRFRRGCNKGAPILSADGRAAVIGENLEFEQGEFFILQTASLIPDIPSWATLVGQPYRLTKSKNAPSFSNSSIQLSYLENEVPRRADDLLTIYYHDETKVGKWEKLATTSAEATALTVNASVKKEGLYIILATITTPKLTQGWNLFAYPNVVSRPVTVALASLDPAKLGCSTYCYSSVYQYQASTSQAVAQWLLYAQNVPAQFDERVNTLRSLEPKNSYWIYATKTVTPVINPGLRSAATMTAFELPPTTFYGEISPSVANGFKPEVGNLVKAKVNGSNCGEGEIFRLQNGQLAYVIQVKSNSGNGCGFTNDGVTFEVGGKTIPDQAVWNNSQACYRPLSFNHTGQESCVIMAFNVYLPLLGK